jgi:hypothetical protein
VRSHAARMNQLHLSLQKSRLPLSFLRARDGV